MKRIVCISACFLMLAAVTTQVIAAPVVSQSVRNDVSPPLYLMQPIAPRSMAPGTVVEIPLGKIGPAIAAARAQPQTPTQDPVLQNLPVINNIPLPSVNFDGVSNVNGVLPPDTEGDVGLNHYVQMNNLSFAIWNKSGTLLFGPAANNTLWAGFGGLCQSNNNGDPIVLYDDVADRWIMSQFALKFTAPMGFHQCIAVSQTPDPTGAWYRYDFLISATKMNDYPKFGVWPDGYYMSVNQFDGVTSNWAGAGAVAFERSKMLAGQPAQQVYFDLAAHANLGGMLPSHADSAAMQPATGAPNYFAQFDDGVPEGRKVRRRYWPARADVFQCPRPCQPAY